MPRTILLILLFLNVGCIAFVYWAARGAYFPSGNGILDASGMFVGRDFVNFWVGAKLFAIGDTTTLLDIQAYLQAVEDAFGQEGGEYLWSYPPHFGLLLIPLAHLPYIASLLLFEFLSLCFLIAVVVAALPTHRRLAAVVLVTSPVILPVLYMGQNGFLSGACIIGAVWWHKRHPLLAAVCLSLLTFKPQLGLAVTIGLLTLGAWRTIGWTSLITSVWIAISAYMFGLDVFWRYVTVTIPHHAELLAAQANNLFIISPFGTLRLLGFSSDTALLWHNCLALLCIAGLVYGLRATECLSRRLWLIAAATFVITPYCQGHDMVALIGATIILLLNNTRSIDSFLAHPTAVFVLMGVWMLPSWSAVLGFNHVPLAAPLLLSAFVVGLMFAVKGKRNAAL